MKNKIELKFGEQVFIAKFGIGFIGEYLYREETNIEQLFEDLQKNTFYVAPKLMMHSINKGTPDANLTSSDIEDLIDENGGFNCVQLAEFLKGFTDSLSANTEEVGKSKKPIPKPKT